MRILWVVNYPIPEIAVEVGMKVNNRGGWLNELSKQLAEVNEFGLIFPINSQSEYKEGSCQGISYFAIPFDKDVLQPQYEKITSFEAVIKKFKPDIVHICGTEYMHAFYAVNACQNLKMLNKTVISIQGLVSVITRHFYGNLERRTIGFPTIKDLIYKDTLLPKLKKSFEERGKYEILSIQMVRHVIGRTDWDYACVNNMNPQIQYHFCNETLRDSFYLNQWRLSECERHSLFVSQCQYPLKGFHHVCEALGSLKKQFPDVHLYTTGRDILSSNWKERVFDSAYERYLRKIINKFDIQENITFLGELSEEEMCRQYCRTHVFVSASSIENSSNSLGEAMLLGVPSVSSDVGGVKNLMLHEKEGFIYQTDAPYMLVHYISKIFMDDSLAERISENAREHALITHDKTKNLLQVMEAYNDILD